MDPTDTVALDNVRERVSSSSSRINLMFIEPCISDPAAMDIIGSNPRLGTPGKSLYAVLFSPVIVVANSGSIVTTVHM